MREDHAQLRVTVEMRALPFEEASARFPDVVKERGPTADARFRRTLNNPSSVFPYIIYMIGSMLVEALACCDFRHDGYQHVYRAHERIVHMVAEQEQI